MTQETYVLLVTQAVPFAQELEMINVKLAEKEDSQKELLVLQNAQLENMKILILKNVKLVKQHVKNVMEKLILNVPFVKMDYSSIKELA